MRIIAIALIVSLLFASAGFSQDPSPKAPAWSVLNSIQIGQKLQVDAKDGKSIKGQLDKISEASLQLTVKGQTRTIQSNEIQRIYILRGRSIGKGIAIGAAVGAGGGAAVGAAAGKDDEWFGIIVLGCALIGFVAGLLTGFGLGLRQKKDLVYEAPPVR